MGTWVWTCPCNHARNAGYRTYRACAADARRHECGRPSVGLWRWVLYIGISLILLGGGASCLFLAYMVSGGGR